MIAKPLGAAALLLLAACGGSDKGDPVNTDARGSNAAAESGGIECALEGAKLFERNCTAQEMTGAHGTVLVVGKPSVGYRRLLITTDGRGVVAADGAEPAKVSIVDNGLIEVAVGGDRYRLPANTGGAK